MMVFVIIPLNFQFQKSIPQTYPSVKIGHSNLHHCKNYNNCINTRVKFLSFESSISISSRV